MRAHQAFVAGDLFMVEKMISDLSQDIRVSIAEDSSVPRNVRSNVVTGLETYLMNEKDDLDLRIYSTISVLEEQINDTNIPQHARTRLFEFIRDLEGIVRNWENKAK
tara:strand:+ start:1436 stop:1756 length:321 start_codon:yes stop_codon:yes gene_type:complete